MGRFESRILPGNSLPLLESALYARATGYVTVAERVPDAKDFPGVPAEKLVAGAVVFTPPSGPIPLDNHLRWWDYVKGASVTIPTSDVSAGETIVPLSAQIFEPGGGMAISGGQVLTYAGIQTAAGGSLVGPGVTPSTARHCSSVMVSK